MGALEGGVVCAGAHAYFGPRLGVGSRAGDMMGLGVPADGLRPLILSRPVPRGVGAIAGSWPRFIGLIGASRVTAEFYGRRA